MDTFWVILFLGVLFTVAYRSGKDWRRKFKAGADKVIAKRKIKKAADFFAEGRKPWGNPSVV